VFTQDAKQAVQLGAGTHGQVVLGMVTRPGESTGTRVAIKVYGMDAAARTAARKRAGKRAGPHQDARETRQCNETCDLAEALTFHLDYPVILADVSTLALLRHVPGVVASVATRYDVASKALTAAMQCHDGDLLWWFKRLPAHTPLATLRPMVASVVAAVARCHLRGVCHRDLKAANILVSCHNDVPEDVVLTDFGFRKGAVLEAAGRSERESRTYGTPYACAPEAMLHCLTSEWTEPANPFAADAWSVGVIAAEMVHRSRPGIVTPLWCVDRLVSTNDGTVECRAVAQAAKRYRPAHWVAAVEQATSPAGAAAILALLDKQENIDDAPLQVPLAMITACPAAELRAETVSRELVAALRATTAPGLPPDDAGPMLDSFLDLCARLMALVPLDRLGVVEALEHPFLAGLPGVPTPRALRQEAAEWLRSRTATESVPVSYWTGHRFGGQVPTSSDWFFAVDWLLSQACTVWPDVDMADFVAGVHLGALAISRGKLTSVQDACLTLAASFLLVQTSAADRLPSMFEAAFAKALDPVTFEISHTSMLGRIWPRDVLAPVTIPGTHVHIDTFAAMARVVDVLEVMKFDVTVAATAWRTMEKWRHKLGPATCDCQTCPSCVAWRSAAFLLLSAVHSSVAMGRLHVDLLAATCLLLGAATAACLPVTPPAVGAGTTPPPAAPVPPCAATSACGPTTEKGLSASKCAGRIAFLAMAATLQCVNCAQDLKVLDQAAGIVLAAAVSYTTPSIRQAPPSRQPKTPPALFSWLQSSPTVTALWERKDGRAAVDAFASPPSDLASWCGCGHTATCVHASTLCAVVPKDAPAGALPAASCI
jgi:serine/threonine protein kinase